MASYHCSVKVGKVGKGAAHAAYITREGVYESLRDREACEKLIHSEHGNLPKWAADRPETFWEEADIRERKNGSVYREFEIALPRELSREQQIKLVRDFVSTELGLHHAYSWGLHEPRAAIDGGKQAHAHIMFSERTRDEIERDPDQYFKRANPAHPERGGCLKSNRFGGGKRSSERKAAIKELRASWAEIQNRHLELAGHSARVDHRSLKDQGIDREPEKHFGPARVKGMSREEVMDILQARAAEGRRERAQDELEKVVDVSSDLAAAKRERWAELQTGWQQRAESDPPEPKPKPKPKESPKPQEQKPVLVLDDEAKAKAKAFAESVADRMRADRKAQDLERQRAASDLAKQRAEADAKAKEEATRPKISRDEWMKAMREANERTREEVEKARVSPRHERNTGPDFSM